MSKKKFNCVDFDDDNKRINILNGDKGFVDYKDIAKVTVLNEKAKYHGKKPHFTALLPHGPLPPGLFVNPHLYVALKVKLKNEDILAIYVSETETMQNTDQYLENRKEAEEIKKLIDKRITEWFLRKLKSLLFSV